MAINIDAVLAAGEESVPFMVVGNCDILVSGLTAGSVALQYKLTPTTALPDPQWTLFPEGTFTTDIYKTVFISEHGVLCKLVGQGNNAGTYVRLSRYLNK